MTFRRIVLIVAVGLMLAACSDRSWHGKSIEGLMPKLEFELTSETGETVTEAVFAGRPVAVYFGFTHCPDICPATLARLVAAVRRLPEPLQQELQLAFISVDPERDGPQQLADYTSAFSDRMLGLTGDTKHLRELMHRYRGTFGYDDKRPDGSYDVSHSSSIYVFDAAGKPRLMLLDRLDVTEMAADLRRLLSAEIESANDA